jgi:peptide/nickel transport system ATP-binding protein/oligopeptide transport system ATP-binding protein
MLEVSHLTTVFDQTGGPVAAVDDVSFEIGAGETLGLVGESGSGKSVTALSVMRLVQPPGRIAGGSVRFKGRELLTLHERDMRRVRGAEIALIFQEPMTALNPVFTIGDQIAETLVVHGRASRGAALAQAVELLEAVRMPDARARVHDYPHQLSGGMRQRASIAIAVAPEPEVIIADECTSALDVLVQADVIDLLRELVHELDTAMIFVTHDLMLAADLCTHVSVMRYGKVVESGPADFVMRAPRHEYTRSLLDAVPTWVPSTAGDHLVADPPTGATT